MYIEESKTKLTIFFNCVLRKQKEKIKPASYSRCLNFLPIQRNKNGLL